MQLVEQKVRLFSYELIEKILCFLENKIDFYHRLTKNKKNVDISISKMIRLHERERLEFPYFLPIPKTRTNRIDRCFPNGSPVFIQLTNVGATRFARVAIDCVICRDPI